MKSDTKTKYTFVRVSPDHRIPQLQGWYLKVHKYDFELHDKLIKAMTNARAWKYFQNKDNFESDGHTRTLVAEITHPMKMCPRWVNTLHTLFKENTYALVNHNFGLCNYPEHEADVHAEFESTEYAFPVLYDDELMTVSRWPEGEHWYVTSNKERIMVPEKHDTLEAAVKAAAVYVTEDKITVKRNTVLPLVNKMREGD